MPHLKTRKAKKPSFTGHTQYHSTQYNSSIVNGRQVATEKTVNISNGKGFINVKKIADGRVLASTRHRLSPSQKKKILNNVFIPDLFRPCIACNTRKMRAKNNISKIRKI